MASPYPTLFDATRPLRSIDPFLDLSREMNRVMDAFFPGAGQLMGVGARLATHAVPRVDVQEDEQAVVISAELPGVDIQDIDVQLEGDTLTLCGEKRAQTETALERYRLMERSFGSFRRTLPLPPRGLYHLHGEARHAWEHSIAPLHATRWSITLRSLSPRGRQAMGLA